MVGFAILAPAGLLLATPAAADCSAAKTTIEMNDCAGQDYRAADAELNAVYAKVKAGAPAEVMALVREAQRAWIPFRDAACTAEAAPYEGGSIQPLIQVSCLTRLTQRRAEDLRALLPN